MASKGRLLFDLNEPPTEDDEENDGVSSSQPQRAVPSSSNHTSDFFAASSGPQRIVNNHAFSHASSLSVFQPFVRLKSSEATKPFNEQENSSGDTALNVGPSLISNGKEHHNITGNTTLNVHSSLISNSQDMKAVLHPNLSFVGTQVIEKEEGEWTDAEGSPDICRNSEIHEHPSSVDDKVQEEKSTVDKVNKSENVVSVKSISQSIENMKDENSIAPPLGPDKDTNEGKNSNSRNSESNGKGDNSMEGQEDTSLMPKQREIRGVEASHALKCASNFAKRPRLDQQKEAMLGKKRSRQTMFLDLEDVKQAGPLKSSTRRQNFPAAVTTRTVKDTQLNVPIADRSGEKQVQPFTKDMKLVDSSCNEGSSSVEPNGSKSECNGDMHVGSLNFSRRMNSSANLAAETPAPSINRQSSWNQPSDQRQMQAKSSQPPIRKPALIGQNLMDPKLGAKKLPSKKQPVVTAQYHDTSVERLLREVTNEKLWHQSDKTELQCVPGSFDSVEEYVRVFEPLLFEECRAQLSSTLEEVTESGSHVKVYVKNVERRERGWYDVILLPESEYKWTFKEGDVAVLSTPRPGSVRLRRGFGVDEEPEINGRVAGTVRRHIPIDKRDPPGAILHFYVGDSYDNSKIDDDNILRKLQPRGTWFLTVLGSLATTQREYVALHAFRRLNSQMQNAILQPSSEHFPKYEEQTPAMPDCFTPNFVEYLHRTFNTPQLAAIQWAATHTAAGTNGIAKRQDPWPFTLVQGPPGTGKTHTVWGMLNVIHLVQYQHYYTALLKKLAPESYKQNNESNLDNVASGSIDEVLLSMDQNLFRTLPKLCPKPRMLVCAPSNAATDELLARVLDRGFIDGEMKVYRPDVARVGVDSQTRAAQAVSVERRTELLLMKSRDEVLGWMHQLRNREAQLSQQIACLQRELNIAAAAGRAQGSVGVDPDVLMARDQNRDSLLQNLAAVVENRDKVLVEMSRLVILEGRFRVGSNFNMEEARANLEASFANEAEIVFTTVSSSGRKLFSRLTHGFDMVVIDEAAQASEVGVLPPLSLGAARCVLVGDPQQLPATVISKAAGTLMYSRSLFERFQQAGCPTMLLSVQYRMHPQIRDFPSKYFYQGRLTDSESVVNLADEGYYKDPLLRPYIFYDITHGRESHRGGSVSYQNTHEAQFCLRLYEHLQKTCKSLGVGKVSVGIITPYKLQLKCLQREFAGVLSTEEGKDIYINTVDAFQGQERDVIIMSCVRASNHGVGFVADIRRMNVALTRARRALWVMGNANALIQSEDWAALIADAKTRKCYMDMDSLPKDLFMVKGPSHARGLRPGPRPRLYDSQLDSRSGTPSEDDEKSNTSHGLRNGNYRQYKPQLENSLDEFDQSGDKPRDVWQYGLHKRQNGPGVGRRNL
ncbi:PREDICTED: uncharacterized protein LOC109170090 isoform X2 [Ipomoea nil]|uniref:uncharacterized protein LOC109170090 isoform X2 n=1 Tax=Ipomoea nil TaxID=35883 RepID=UPI000901E0A9|nr:PREDICTED: uncharacterized protein LOC109170090 isoform X2 [Ipomoea nil]